MELTVEQVFAGIGVTSATFTLSDQRAIGRDRGGVLHPSSYGARLWQGSVTVRAYRHINLGAIEARLEALTEGDGTFLIWPPASGDRLVTAGEITGIASEDRRRVYVTNASSLAEGSFVGIVYDGGRRSVHRVLTRSGSSLFVVPPLPMAVAVGAAVTYGRPLLRAIVDAGGYSAPAYRAAVGDGLSFAWTQTMRPAP